MLIHKSARSLFCMLFILAVPAHAETEPPALSTSQETTSAVPLPTGTLKELEKINTQTLLTEAQAQLANARASLAKASQEQWQNSNDPALQPIVPDTHLPPGLPNPAVNQTQPTRSSTPKIVEISGQGRALSARLSLNNGLAVIVRTGSRIPGSDLIVTAITASSIEVKDAHGARHTLTFGE
ncbi:type IV pilus biogenesis protein PilP [Photorhabdus sp. RM71S]|uniref:type IV pilus biogenesis protein PilP n=1 Tax=Photorhabdus sp. RM71S TaxID=3342824 RepID=UPI0036DC766D